MESGLSITFSVFQNEIAIIWGVAKRTTSRFKQLGLQQRSICYRLAYLRKCADMTQWTCADRIGLTRAQLANVESGRVSLKTEAAWSICKLFEVHPAWLANGRTEASIYDLPDEVLAALEQRVKSAPKIPFLDFWTDIAWQVHEISGKESKFKIDNSESTVNLEAVKLKVPTWAELKLEIIRLTPKRGQKSALARDMNISRQVLGNWLSDESQAAPNADQTLKLLRRFWKFEC